MSTIKQLNRKANLKPYRKIEIKRRLADGTGDYESDWFDATNYIKTMGTLSLALDKETVGVFVQNSMTIVGDNTESAWADPSDSESIFFGFLTRNKTIFRISIGLKDDDGTIVPSNRGVFYGMLTGDVILTESEATMTINSMSNVFSQVSASRATFLATDTAKDIVGKILAIEDEGSNRVFDRFITGSYADTTSVQYPDVVGSSALENQSCWDIIQRMCLAEDMAAFVDGNGSFYFVNKSSGTTIDWKFFGPGVYDEEYGVNIAEIRNSNYVWSKIYNKVVVEHTEGSFVTAGGGTWQQGDASSIDKYGERILSISEFWLDAAGAATIAAELYNSYANPKREVNILTSTFNPELKLLDRTQVTYFGELFDAGGIFGYHVFGTSWQPDNQVGVFSGVRGGIYLDKVSMNIIGIDYDLDAFNTTFQLREI